MIEGKEPIATAQKFPDIVFEQLSLALLANAVKNDAGRPGI